jgi:hypothetical protein
MGALVAVVLTGIIIVGAFRYLMKKEVREAAHSAALHKPVTWAFIAFGVVSLLTFFWGVFIPAIGNIKIPIGYTDIRLWQLGGIGSGLWLIICLGSGKLGE